MPRPWDYIAKTLQESSGGIKILNDPTLTLRYEKIIITRQTHHHYKIWKKCHPIFENEIVPFLREKLSGCVRKCHGIVSQG